MLSKEALEYLYEHDYQNLPHEERMALIKKAKELYPNTDGEED